VILHLVCNRCTRNVLWWWWWRWYLHVSSPLFHHVSIRGTHGAQQTARLSSRSQCCTIVWQYSTTMYSAAWQLLSPTVSARHLDRQSTWTLFLLQQNYVVHTKRYLSHRHYLFTVQTCISRVSMLFQHSLKMQSLHSKDHNRFTTLFSRTTRVSRCQKGTSGLYGAREDWQRQTHRPSGWAPLHPD